MSDQDKNPQESARQRADDPYGGGLSELPPNVPPGFLGERGGLNLRKVDEESHGLNAGVIQEWTAETTVMVIILAYIFFFPAAFVILWRTKKLSRRQKMISTVVMTAGVVYFGGRFLGLF